MWMIIAMGANDMRETFTLHRESKEIFSKGGFNLQKFATNWQGLIDAEEHRSEIPTETFAQHTLGRIVGSLKSGQQKVLGVLWSLDEDEIVIDLQHIFNEAVSIEPTKRRVIGLVSKIYDPTGLISPVVVRSCVSQD